MSARLFAFTRVNLWHFVWIAVVLSVLLSLLLSQLIHGQILLEYPFAATFIAFTVALLLISLIKHMRGLEQALAEHTGHRVQDVIERRRTEDALRESQERFSSAFKDAAIGMALVGRDGRWLQVNPALCALVGYTEQELLATTFQAITHPDDLNADLAFVRQMLAGEIPTYHMEKRYFHKQGHIVWILLTVSLVRDSVGQPLYFIGQIQDITERKQVEEQLHESEARLRAILDNSPNMVFLKDTEGRYLFVNRQFERTFHLNRMTLVGKTDDEIFPPQQAAAFQANDRKVVQAGVALHFEEVALHDDDPHTSIVVKFPLHTMHGKLYGVGGMTTDITDRKRVDEEIRASESHLRAFMDNSPAAVFIKDQDGRYVYINRTIERRFETTAAHWIGKTDSELWPKAVAERLRANDLIVLSQGPSSNALEVVESVPDSTGSDSYWLSCKFPLHNSVGPCLLGGIAMDITESRNTEEALRTSEQRLRQALDDRERLSQDLHDHVIQSIYAIGMALESCHYLIEKDPGLVALRLQSSIADLNGVMKEVRNYIEWASPTLTGSDQLREALEDLVRTIPTARPLAIRLEIDPSTVGQLTAEEATHVLQIAREAVSNSLRHSGAKTGAVSLCKTDGGLRLEVRDDGGGFDTKSGEGHGLGLRNMAARASKLDATLTVLSERGRGTQIILDIPKEHHHASRPSAIDPAAAR